MYICIYASLNIIVVIKRRCMNLQANMAAVTQNRRMALAYTSACRIFGTITVDGVAPNMLCKLEKITTSRTTSEWSPIKKWLAL